MCFWGTVKNLNIRRIDYAYIRGMKTQIKLVTETGGQIAYLHEHDELEALGLPKLTNSDALSFLEIGSKIEYEGTKYKVVDLALKIYPSNVAKSESTDVQLTVSVMAL